MIRTLKEHEMICVDGDYSEFLLALDPVADELHVFKPTKAKNPQFAIRHKHVLYVPLASFSASQTMSILQDRL